MYRMVLRFLTDENVSKSLVNALRQKGYYVKDIKKEKLFGTSDRDIVTILTGKYNWAIVARS